MNMYLWAVQLDEVHQAVGRHVVGCHHTLAWKLRLNHLGQLLAQLHSTHKLTLVYAYISSYNLLIIATVSVSQKAQFTDVL